MFLELSAVLNPDLFAVYYLESLKNHKVTVSAKKALNVSSFFKFLRLSFYWQPVKPNVFNLDLAHRQMGH